VTAQVVRQPLATREGAGRTLDQRIQLRFPRAATLNALLISRLPPSSGIRQAILRRTAQLSLEAFNRRDLDAVVPGRIPRSSTTRTATGPRRAWSSPATAV
jgi:hypothetical protein